MEHSPRQRLAAAIRAVQEARHLTQKDFVDDIGVSYTFLYLFMTGDREFAPDTLARMAHTYPELQDAINDYWMARIAPANEPVAS
jgi:transcriptional regulator with XRE-family HTH domain